MKKFFLFIFLLPILALSQNKPKLVIGIVVDQMRYEMLDRYQSDFGPDGFNLLLKEGYRFDSCKIAYVPTYTSPGHATIFTGVLPAVHGITSNDIYFPQQNQFVYSVGDENAEPVGTDDVDAKRSPKLMNGYTFSDSLKLKNPKSKIISVSLKDRGAILSAGKLADGCYWLDKYGHFVSSSFYMNELPKWVERFNSEENAQTYLSKSWELLNAEETYNESLPDNSAFESLRFGDVTFPHDLAALNEKLGGKAIAHTPFGNSLLTDFIFEALENEDLGKDDDIDFLTAIYSATDYIGHDFGPNSVEAQDTYLRLDLELAKLIKKLDAEIGRENYVLFLSSDHGVANTPSDSNFKYVSKSALKDCASAYVEGMYGVDVVAEVSSSQIWLYNDLIRQHGLDKEEVVAALKSYLSYQTKVVLKSVFTNFEVSNCQNADCMPFKNAYVPELAGDLFYVRPFGEIERTSTTGTTHSTHYEYDSHVPLIFFGGNVEAGISKQNIGSQNIIRELKNFF